MSYQSPKRKRRSGQWNQFGPVVVHDGWKDTIAWRRALLLCLAVSLIWAAGPVRAGVLTPQEERGKRIYVHGENASGAPITALVSRGSTPIDASFLPCIGCHGDDGKGRPEGGVMPPDITWQTLTASYGHDHAYSRSHPSFDEGSLARAIMVGVDPAGNSLDTAMPRYSMSESDMTDLVAYIKRIQSDRDPGISATDIRLGTLLPLKGSRESLGRAMKSVLEAYFSEVNARGGIHGRKIELVVGEYDVDPTYGGWNTRDLLQQQSIFAMVSGYIEGIEDEVAALVEESAIPLVGPFTMSPPIGNGLNRYGFYLLAGLTQQAQVLARHFWATQNTGDRRLAILHPEGEIYAAAAGAVQADNKVKGVAPVVTKSYRPDEFDAADAAKMLKNGEVRGVLFLGTANDLERLAREAERIDWAPSLLFPGVFARKPMFEIPASFEDRVFVGYSSLPSDHTVDGVNGFESLHDQHELDYRHSAAQISAYVAAMIMLEGLKRAGKDLSRDKLVSELEGLSDFQPGLMPAISYNTTRRIGALGGYVVVLNLQQDTFGKTSKWIALQP